MQGKNSAVHAGYAHYADGQSTTVVLFSPPTSNSRCGSSNIAGSVKIRYATTIYSQQGDRFDTKMELLSAVSTPRQAMLESSMNTEENREEATLLMEG